MLLIVFNDSLGGLLYVVSVLVEIFFILWPKVASGKLGNWSASDSSEVAFL